MGESSNVFHFKIASNFKVNNIWIEPIIYQIEQQKFETVFKAVVEVVLKQKFSGKH
jgi:hypothetical protein